MNANIIYKKVEDFVTDMFDQHTNDKLIFHNFKHTATVVERTKEIAAHYNLTEKEMLVLYVAAWFHDVGHLFMPGLKNHEEKGIEVMKKFMNENDNDKDLINEIEN